MKKKKWIWPHIEHSLGKQEQAYRQEFLVSDIGKAKTAIWITASAAISLSFIDYLFYYFHPIFFDLLIMRGLFIIFSIGILLVLRMINQVKIFDFCIFIWFICLAALILIVDFFRPSDFIQNQMIYILVGFCIYTVIPIPQFFRFLPAFLLTTLDFWLLWFIKTGIPLPVLVFTTFMLVFMHFMGFIVSSQMYTYRRNQYLAQIAEREIIKQLEKFAATDSLTGLLNRRKFSEEAESEFIRYKRYGMKFSILMIDFDYFKEINDEYGHSIGDEVLTHFSRIVDEKKRKNDLIGRMGGEEFCILLPETSVDEAMRPAERIRKDCSEIVIDELKEKTKVSISVGLTEVKSEDTSLGDVIQRADKALYQAKQDGRNRCVVG